MSGRFLQVIALGLDPAWRHRSAEERSADLATLCAADASAQAQGIVSLTYSSVGLEPGVDLVVWRTGERLDELEAASARLLRAGLGGWLTVRHALIGRFATSQYAAKPTEQEGGLVDGERSRYLIVYPFTKSTDWYLLSREARQGVMNEHMRVGRAFPSVRQALAYAFGLDDSDFIVAYETDDLATFGELVRELRGTESRRSTVRDTPLLLAVRRPLDEIGELLGASA